MPYIVGYIIGVVVALAVMRDPWPARIRTAVVWPLGPIAFAVVVVILLAASAILWPLPVIGAAILAGAIWLLA